MSDEAETTGVGARGSSRRRKPEATAPAPPPEAAATNPAGAESETTAAPTDDAGATTTVEQPAASDEPRFSRERVLGQDGPRICGHPAHVIAGALHGTTAEAFTRGEVTRLVEEFMTRPAGGQEG